jgi:hypothetical protein
VPRHVVNVEGKGLPTPRRVKRQRQIVRELSARYRSLLASDRGISSSYLRPIRSYGFSTRTPPEEAVAKLVALLDEVDPDWRSFVRVRDGFPHGKPVRA